MNFNIKVLPAFYGDSILLSYKEKCGTQNILIDGGITKTYNRVLKSEIKKLEEKEQKLKLIVVTHIDCDHINGIIPLFTKKPFKPDLIENVWFNSGLIISRELSGIQDKSKCLEVSDDNDPRTGVRQGVMLEDVLKELNCWSEDLIYAGRVFQNEKEEAKITILSPDSTTLERLNNKWQIEENKDKLTAGASTDYNLTIEQLTKKIESESFKEDKSIPNGSSISFLFEHNGRKLMFLGDAHPSVVAGTLKQNYTSENPLKVDIVKISHHASKGNTSDNLLDLIDTENFIISTDGKRHGLPDKICLVRIINHNKKKGRKINFFFNYDIGEQIFKCDNDLVTKYGVRVINLKDHGYNIDESFL